MPPSTAIAPEELQSASFAGIYETPIRLDGGRFIGDTFTTDGVSRPQVQLVPELQLHGDLNDDNLAEALVLLVVSSGGSGTRIYLALMGYRGGQLTNLDTLLLGDRVQIRELTANGRSITAELIEHGPGDAACCPQAVVRHEWRLINERLVHHSKAELGTLSLSLLDGVTWHLASLSTNEKNISNKTISLQVHELQLSGFGGCNRYRASATETGAGTLSVGPVAATRMTCGEPRDATESRYLEALQSVRRLSFVFGKLALTYRGEQEVDQLLFRAHKGYE